MGIAIDNFLIELVMVLWFTLSLFGVFWLDVFRQSAKLKTVSTLSILYFLTVSSLIGVSMFGLGLLLKLGPFKDLSERLEFLEVPISFETLVLGYVFMVVVVLLTNILAIGGKLSQLGSIVMVSSFLFALFVFSLFSPRWLFNLVVPTTIFLLSISSAYISNRLTFLNGMCFFSPLFGWMVIHTIHLLEHNG